MHPRFPSSMVIAQQGLFFSLALIQKAYFPASILMHVDVTSPESMFSPSTEAAHHILICAIRRILSILFDVRK